MWFFYLDRHQHRAGIYHEYSVELNSNLVPHRGWDAPKASLGRNAFLETSPHIPARA